MEYGYGRVSSRSQNLDRQIRELLSQGIKPKNIFTDKFTGATINRPEFQKLLRIVKTGDVIFICSFDRLGRNYKECVEIWNLLTKKMGVNIVVLDFELLDTREKACGEMGEFIRDIVVQCLAYVADSERKKNKKAQKDGIKAKKARGEWDEYGRPLKLDLESFCSCYKELVEQKKTKQEIIEEMEISESTFYRYKKKMVAAKKLGAINST